MELVASSVPPATPLSYIMYYPDSGVRGRREGSGSTEATEMILNNLFYITAKVSTKRLILYSLSLSWNSLFYIWGIGMAGKLIKFKCLVSLDISNSITVPKDTIVNN